MNNEITVNDHKATLESFLMRVACLKLKDESINELQNRSNFYRDMFKRHESNIVESDWFGSGGGCYHLLFRLDDGRIIAMHTDNHCEQSFDTWDSIEDYCSAESNDKCKGFGWEHEAPNYHDRCQAIA